MNYLAPRLQRLSLRSNGLRCSADFPLFSLTSPPQQGPSEGPQGAAAADPQQPQQQQQQLWCMCSRCQHPFRDVRTLDVSGNHLNFKSLVAAVGRLPSLRNLLAADNGILSVPLPSGVLAALLQQQQQQQQQQHQQQHQQQEDSKALCSLVDFYERHTGSSREDLTRITELSLEGNPLIDQYVDTTWALLFRV